MKESIPLYFYRALDRASNGQADSIISDLKDHLERQPSNVFKCVDGKLHLYHYYKRKWISFEDIPFEDMSDDEFVKDLCNIIMNGRTETYHNSVLTNSYKRQISDSFTWE